MSRPKVIAATVGNNYKEMRTIQIILIITLLVNITFAQDFSGRYYDNSDLIEFVNDSADFKIMSNGGLTVQLCASGTFEVIGNFLLIEASDYKGEKSTVTTIGKINDLPQINIIDKNGKKILYVNVVLTDSLGKFIWGTTTNEFGMATIENQQSAEKLKISFIGYDQITIDYIKGLDYHVKLVDYDILENQTIVFKINLWDKEYLNLTLLATDFKFKKDKIKELNRLEKKTKKYRFKERKFVK